MIPIGVLLGMLITGGVFMAILGLRRYEPAPPAPSTPSAVETRLRRALRLTPDERTRVIVAAVLTVVFAIFTGWAVLILVVPVAAVLIPRLISTKAEQHRIARLEAMGEWTRSLSGVLTGAGAGLTEALVATLRTAPQPIRPEVERLVARLQAGRPTKDALRAFADDLDDQVGDLIAASLLLGASESGAGLSRILDSLASSVGSQVNMRRSIEAERGSNRSQAKSLTLFSIVALALFVLFTPFGRAYQTPVGQVLLVVMLCAMGGCLYWLKQTTTSKPATRFLPASQPPGSDAR